MKRGQLAEEGGGRPESSIGFCLSSSRLKVKIIFDSTIDHWCVRVCVCERECVMIPCSTPDVSPDANMAADKYE